MKKTFVCGDCKREFPEGLDVEIDFFLDSNTMLKRCVFCYNKKTCYPLDIQQCYEYAFNLERYGVAILPEKSAQ